MSFHVVLCLLSETFIIKLVIHDKLSDSHIDPLFSSVYLSLMLRVRACAHTIAVNCKFGLACRFDHSIPPAFSFSSSQTIEASQVSGNGNENDN